MFVGLLSGTSVAFWLRGTVGWRHVFLLPAAVCALLALLVLRLLRMPSGASGASGTGHLNVTDGGEAGIKVSPPPPSMPSVSGVASGTARPPLELSTSPAAAEDHGSAASATSPADGPSPLSSPTGKASQMTASAATSTANTTSTAAAVGAAASPAKAGVGGSIVPRSELIQRAEPVAGVHAWVADRGFTTDTESEAEGEVFVIEAVHRGKSLRSAEVARLPMVKELAAAYFCVNALR
jgi:hypothetical protein